jgi:hypothetical protein
MNLILRSAAKGLLWGVVFAAGAVLPPAAQAGGWRDGDARHGDDAYGYGDEYGYDDDRYGDVRYVDDARYGYDDPRRHGYGYGRGGGHEGRWHDERRSGWIHDRGRHGGRVWCPQRRAYVLPWEVRSWRGDRHHRWRHRDRYRHWRSW